MDQWKTTGGIRISRILSGRANAYLVNTGETTVIIDTGPLRCYDRLRKNISGLPVKSDTVDWLLLTHVHFDHCQNATRLQMDYGCRIITGEEDAEAAMKGYNRVPDGTSFFPKIVHRASYLLGNEQYRHEPFSPDTQVGSGSILINDDERLKVIATPGHTAGSISLVVEGEIALVGDTMFGIFKRSIFPPFCNDVPEMFLSWEKLLETGCHNYLPGHGKAITRDRLQQQLMTANRQPLTAN